MHTRHAYVKSRLKKRKDPQQRDMWQKLDSLSNTQGKKILCLTLGEIAMASLIVLIKLID